MRPWVLRHRGILRPLTVARTYVLPSTGQKVSASRTTALSVLISPGHTHRYRRFSATLTSDTARLAEICDWLDLHNAGLPPATLPPVSLAHPSAAQTARTVFP